MKYILIFIYITVFLQASSKFEIELNYQKNYLKILNEQKILLHSLNKKDKPQNLIKKYGFDKIPLTKKNILKRVQPIPKEIMLAQAYLESNNGNSRFAKKGYNYFGIWTYNSKDKGFIPKKREKGKKHRVQKFNSTEEAINKYTEILNSAIFYNKFRNIRKKILEKYNYKYSFKNNDILYMVEGLNKYSEDKNYINKLKSIIKERKYDN